MKHVIKNIHFVGIGGAGMSGIAEVLYTLGYCVSGSDAHSSYVTQHLQNIGIRVFIGHEAEHVAQAQVLVISSAIAAQNPEVLYARQHGIPIVPRALMLAELMRFKQGIAIAGTHGKTTTTSLVTSILACAGLDPTFVIGGKLNAMGVNACLGSGDFLVAEADESDASFLHLSPIMQVITNIDADHMETYDHSFAKLKQAFINFVHNMPFYGQLIACVDNKYVREILPMLARSVISYGIEEKGAMYRASQVLAFTGADAGKMRFTAHRFHASDLDIVLNIPGVHNVYNALAAIAVATELNIDDAAIVQALAEFKGVGRRFQRHQLTTTRGVPYTFIDDYAHHPNEIIATLQAARAAYPEKKIVIIFQPHRYTRTRDCFSDFVDVLRHADRLILLPVYAASEAPIAGVNSEAMAQAIMRHGLTTVLPENLKDIAPILDELVDANTLVLSMGAGSVGGLPNLLAHEHEQK